MSAFRVILLPGTCSRPSLRTVLSSPRSARRSTRFRRISRSMRRPSRRRTRPRGRDRGRAARGGRTRLGPIPSRRVLGRGSGLARASPRRDRNGLRAWRCSSPRGREPRDLERRREGALARAGPARRTRGRTVHADFHAARAQARRPDPGAAPGVPAALDGQTSGRDPRVQARFRRGDIDRRGPPRFDRPVYAPSALSSNLDQYGEIANV